MQERCPRMPSLRKKTEAYNNLTDNLSIAGMFRNSQKEELNTDSLSKTCFQRLSYGSWENL